MWLIFHPAWCIEIFNLNMDWSDMSDTDYEQSGPVMVGCPAGTVGCGIELGQSLM